MSDQVGELQCAQWFVCSPILSRAQKMKGSLIFPKYFLTGWELKGDPDIVSPTWFIGPQMNKMATG